jgi:16S rRNA methyltransferase RsmB/F
LTYTNPLVTAILLDPSCSGGHSTDATKNDHRLDQLSAFQSKALLHALTAFPNCTTVVYSTCSKTLVENESIVRQCLQKLHGGATSSVEQQQQLQPGWKLMTALPGWKMRGRDDCPDETIQTSTLRHEDGFFVAVFQRTNMHNNSTTNACMTATSQTNKRRKKQQWKERQTKAKRQRLKKKPVVSQPQTTNKSDQVLDT